MLSAISSKRFTETSELKASGNELSSQRILKRLSIMYPAVRKVVNSNRK